MTNLHLTLAVTLVAVVPSAAEAGPRRAHPVLARTIVRDAAPLAFVNSAAVFAYSEGVVYRVPTAPGLVTDLALQPGETLAAVASGDTVRWVIGDTSSGSGAEKRAHVLVKPIVAGLVTNLVITTDRRTYHVALTSGGVGGMSAASWTYPQDALLAVTKRSDEPRQAAAVPPNAPFDPATLHFDYAISGDQVAWRPLRAFDDGRRTFLEFSPALATTEAPPLFLIAHDGEAQLVNYRVRGRFYVVDRLIDVAELRLGTKHQQIVRITRLSPTATAGTVRS